MSGSGEFEPWCDELDRFLLDGSRGDGSVVILPTASAPDGDTTFRAWAMRGLRHYERLGATATALGLVDRADAYRAEVVRRLETPSLIFLSGGKPDYLAATLLGTPAWDAIVAALDRGAAIVGCSAGMCLLGGSAPSNVTANPHEVRWRDGSRLVGNRLLIPHWDAIDHSAPGARAHLLNGFAGHRQVVAVTERTAIATVGGPWRVFGKGYAFVQSGGASARYPAEQQFDLDSVPASQTVPLFHRTSRTEAAEILRGGFRDGAAKPSLGGAKREGVWLSDRPGAAIPGVSGDAVLVVEVDPASVERHRLSTPGRDFDEICIPASILNGFPVTDLEPAEGTG